MPGIFLGSTPLNMGAPVKEVYYGSTKVWPTTPIVDVNYGIKIYWYTPMQTTYLYKSNPEAVLINPLFIGAADLFPFGYPIEWVRKGAITGGNYGQSPSPGSRVCVGAAAEIGVTNDRFRTLTYTGSGTSNTNSMVCMFVDESEGDPVRDKQQFARFDDAGNLLWALTAGWSCTRLSLGSYSVTYPADITVESDLMLASCIWSGTTTGQEFEAVVSDHNPTNRTFLVQLFLQSTGLGDSGFSVMVVSQ